MSEDISEERQREIRQEGWDDRQNYQELLVKIHNSLRVVQEGRIPKRFTDEDIKDFIGSVKIAYKGAKRLSDRYGHIGDRTRELNQLGELVGQICEGLNQGVGK